MKAKATASKEVYFFPTSPLYKTGRSIISAVTFLPYTCEKKIYDGITHEIVVDMFVLNP